MRLNLNFMNFLREVTEIFSNETADNPENNALQDFGRKKMCKVMTNEELINTLKNLKREGISHRYIAKECNIKESTFYNYIYKNSFPYQVREQITNYIYDKFSEVLNSYV